jgi:hypothetical protein
MFNDILKNLESKIEDLQITESEKLNLDIINAFDTMQEKILNDYDDGKKDFKLDPKLLQSPILDAMSNSYELGKAIGEFTLKEMLKSQ